MISQTGAYLFNAENAEVRGERRGSNRGLSLRSLPFSALSALKRRAAIMRW